MPEPLPDACPCSFAQILDEGWWPVGADELEALRATAPAAREGHPK